MIVFYQSHGLIKQPKRKGVRLMRYLVFDANVSQRWRRVKEFVESCDDVDFWAEIKKHTRSLLKDLIDMTMSEEMTN